MLLSGYDSDIVQDGVSKYFSSSALQLLGAEEKSVTGWYKLAFTMTPSDVAK